MKRLREKSGRDGALKRAKRVKISCKGGTMVAEVGGTSSPEVNMLPASRRMQKTWDQASSFLAEEGLVLLRGLLPKRTVLQARRLLLQELKVANALDSRRPPDEAKVSKECLAGKQPMPSLLGRLDVQSQPAVLKVLEHPNLFAATARLLGTDKVVTTAYKWLRAVPPGCFTGPHMDRAYVGAGKRLTAWVPFGPVEAKQKGLGVLAWIPGSHRSTALVEKYKEYHRAGADGERSGWLAPDPGALELPEGCFWRSTNFEPGDVAVFAMDLLHTTVPNGTKSFRLSCDTRWQPADDPPGEVPVGPWRGQCPAD